MRRWVNKEDPIWKDERIAELENECERLRAKFKPMKCGHPAYNDDSYCGCVACQFHERDAESEQLESEVERLVCQIIKTLKGTE